MFPNREAGWTSAVKANLGSKLRALKPFGLTVTPGGRATGYHAVVAIDAPVDPNLGLDAYGETTALFRIDDIQDGPDGETLVDDAFFTNAVAALADAVPETSEHAFGAHLLGTAGGAWIADGDAVPTLGDTGKVAVVSRDGVFNDAGKKVNAYYVMVKVSSPLLGEQADEHLSRHIGATYLDLVNNTSDEYHGTTANQLFSTKQSGETDVEAIGQRMAVAAAEAVGAALGIRYTNTAHDMLLRRTRPVAAVMHTTNFMRPATVNGEPVMEIFAGTVPVKGAVVYDFGSTSNVGLAAAPSSAVVPVGDPDVAGAVSYELDFGARSHADRLAVNRAFTWERKDAGVGSPALREAHGFGTRLAAAQRTCGDTFSILEIKAAKVVSNNPLDQPMAPGDVLL